MANKRYKQGYRFEKKVQKQLEEEGALVFRQGSSRFPDLIVLWPKLPLNDILEDTEKIVDIREEQERVWLVECKSGKKKYISKDEQDRFSNLEDYALCLVAWREQNPNDGRKKDTVFGLYKDYEEVKRI